MTATTDTTPSGYILDSNPFGLNGDDVQMADHVKNKRQLQSQIALLHSNDGKFLAEFQSCAGPACSSKRKIYKNAFLARIGQSHMERLLVRKDSLGLDGYICVREPIPRTNIYRYPCPKCVRLWPECDSGATCVAIPNQRHIVVDEPNDGVVPVRSQRGYTNKKGGGK